LKNPPPGFRLVLGSRGDPPLQLSRLQVRQRLFELRAADLRFVSDEVSAFCEATLGVKLSKQSTHLLERSTEGWAAGLQLASTLISQRHSAPQDQDIATLARKLSGSDRAIFEYLAEEVLSQQSQEMQRFLMFTSILNQFNAELCGALIGGDNQSLWLHALDRENLFITPIGDEAGWYHYHHLFADFLQTHLAQTVSDQAKALHWWLRVGLLVRVILLRLWSMRWPDQITYWLQICSRLMSGSRLWLVAS
jgi:LuxR family maltose regulon positive regulatory protein